MGRDYEILNTKLDIEKLLLFQWAERVRLFRSDYDKRLNDLIIRTTVERVLANVKTLLSESTDLQQRYGMKKVAVKTHGDITPTISGNRMARFVETFRKINVRGDFDRKGVSHRDRICSTITDREKFHTLILDLSYFISQLDKAVPSQADEALSMIEKDLEDVHNHTNLRIILEATSQHKKKIAYLTKKVIQQRSEQRVLQRL